MKLTKKIRTGVLVIVMLLVWWAISLCMEVESLYETFDLFGWYLLSMAVAVYELNLEDKEDDKK